VQADDRGFTANGRQYALLVSAPASRWGHYSDLMKTIFDSFQPAR
jgi:hypothetical protein